MNPVVSIIVPCYNQAQYLDECLQSVFDQTYQNWECIIVNDGSPDETEKIATAWQIKDSRFVYLFKENGGVSSARNLGIENAKGEYILPLDADDKISNEYLKLGVAAFENGHELTIVYCNAEKFGKVSGVWILPEYSLERLTLENMIFCSGIFKKEDWRKVGGYDENLIYGSEDWEFWIALLKNGGRVEKLNHLGFYYRIKEESRTTLIDFEKLIVIQKYILAKHADLYLKTLHYFSKQIHELGRKHQSEKFLFNELSFQVIGKRWFNINV